MVPTLSKTTYRTLLIDVSIYKFHVAGRLQQVIESNILLFPFFNAGMSGEKCRKVLHLTFLLLIFSLLRNHQLHFFIWSSQSTAVYYLFFTFFTEEPW